MESKTSCTNCNGTGAVPASASAMVDGVDDGGLESCRQCELADGHDGIRDALALCQYVGEPGRKLSAGLYDGMAVVVELRDGDLFLTAHVKGEGLQCDLWMVATSTDGWVGTELDRSVSRADFVIAAVSFLQRRKAEQLETASA